MWTPQLVMIFLCGWQQHGPGGVQISSLFTTDLFLLLKTPFICLAPTLLYVFFLRYGTFQEVWFAGHILLLLGIIYIFTTRYIALAAAEIVFYLTILATILDHSILHGPCYLGHFQLNSKIYRVIFYFLHKHNSII